MALLSFDGDNAYKKYAETSVSKKFKLIPIESIKIEGGEVSQDDIYLLESLGLRGSFTIDICGDIYSGVKICETDIIGDVEKYGVCIRFTPYGESGRVIYSCELDPKKYGKDLSTSYYLRFYAEVSDVDITNDYRFLVDKKRAVEFGEDANLIAAKPYIEETYDTNGNLIGAKLYGHTFIRGQMYANIRYLKSIEIPDNIGYIGDIAFQNCTNLALTSLPEGLMSIELGAFDGCTNLALTSLPDGLTSIGHSAFQRCTSLALTSLPAGLTSISYEAFKNCTSLTSITFKGTPSSIMSSAFSGCINLTDIKVPWAEGAVANAPWGATNATITYNYVGE